MKKLVSLVMLLVLILLLSPCVFAGTIRAYIAPFTVTGVQNRDDLTNTLQSLLASRLASDTILVLDSQNDSDVTVIGRYSAFGKSFSVDAVAKDAAGGVVARAFVQGEGQEQLIPSLGKLAKALAGNIEKSSTLSVAAASAPSTAAGKLTEKSNIVRGTPLVPSSEIIVRPPQEQDAAPVQLTTPLSGELVGIAPGTLRHQGAREWYVIGNHSLRLYLQEGKLRVLAEVSYRPNEFLLGVDTADLDGDGAPEAYLTVMKEEELSSEVWIFRDGALKRVAQKLPYFFRGISLAGRDRKIYVQQMGRNSGSTSIVYGRTDSDFFGDVYELEKRGDRYETKNPMRLPRTAFLYNFNMFHSADGHAYFVVLNDDGFLVVYSTSGEELWRSNEKYGGTKLSFKRGDAMNARITGTPYREVFLQQRIFTTMKGDVIVPQISGAVIGMQRFYNNSAVYSFGWNGASLYEKWHTKPEQTYTSDFYFDEMTKELTLLEIVRPESGFTQGASIISIKKTE